MRVSKIFPGFFLFVLIGVSGGVLAANDLETQMTVVASGPDAIDAFIKAGGKFTDDQNEDGVTVGEVAVSFAWNVESIDAFARAGGHFTDQQNHFGMTAAMHAVQWPDMIRAYAKAGGHFSNIQDTGGRTAAMWAIRSGAESVKTFSEVGGKFTDQQDTDGQTAEMQAAKKGPEVLQAYNEAVKKQGGLITIAPENEYAAARNGATGIESFAKTGGKFTDKSDADGMTSAIIAATHGAKAIEAYVKAGGHFTNQQTKDGYTAGMAAVFCGADAIRAFVKTGGHFTDQRDKRGMTAAMWVVDNDALGTDARTELGFPMSYFLRYNTGDEKAELKHLDEDYMNAITAFSEVGGRFNDQQDNAGRTAAMMVAHNNSDVAAAAIEAFSKAGGKFTEEQDKMGMTAAMNALWTADIRGPDVLKAFIKAGGKFTDQQDKEGMTAGMYAAAGENPKTILSFAEAGGTFTDQKDKNGHTAEWFAKNGSVFGFLNSLNPEDMKKMENRKENSQEAAETENLITSLKTRASQRNSEAGRIYDNVIARQGGVRHVSSQ